MKCLFVYLLLSFSFTSNCQTDYADSSFLKKYSYQLFGYSFAGSKFSSYSGTGFFIKKSERLFFITAKHVVSGCDDSLKKKIIPFPISMSIMTRDKYDSLSGDIPIDIRAAYQSIICDSVDIQPDFYVFEMNASMISKIYSADSFVIPIIERVSKMIIFGYPGVEFVKNMAFSPASNISFNISEKDFSIPIINKDTQNFNYFIPANIKDDIHGYSGSPVFIKEKGKENWRIVGLLAGYVEDKGYLVVCRIENILKKIDSILMLNQ